MDENEKVVAAGDGQVSEECVEKRGCDDISIVVGQLYKFDKGVKFVLEGRRATAESEFVGEIVAVDGSIVTLSVNKQDVTMDKVDVIKSGVLVEKKTVKLTDAQRTFLMLHEAAVMFISTFNQAMVLENVSRDERKQAVRDFLKSGRIDNKFAEKMVSIIDLTLGSKQQKERSDADSSGKSEKV